MMRSLIPAVMLALAGPAAAQIWATPTPFCNGRLVAEIFDTQVIPGAQGRSTYSMRVFNPGREALRFQVQVVGDVLGRPVGQTSIAPGARLSVALGYSLNLPQRQPLRGENLAMATRVSCM
jgi:hypothetical protein